MKAQANNKWILVILLISIFVSRFLPWSPNFSPIYALVIFSGAMVRPRWLALALPLIGVLFSDIVIGFYDGIISVYFAYVVVALGGMWFQPLQKKMSWNRCFAASFFASLSFFFISNIGVWQQGLLYPKTFLGLWTCLVAGLPFFEMSLTSVCLFSVLLFKSAELLLRSDRKVSYAREI